MPRSVTGEKSNNQPNNYDEVVPVFKNVYEFMVQERLVYLRIEKEGYRLEIKRRTTNIPGTTTLKETLPGKRIGFDDIREIQSAHQKENAATETIISSPLVGIFYRAGSPKANPFVQPGQVVEKGQIMCIIEAMKVMNEIPATIRCKIERILIENGQPVSVGQPLFAVVSIG